MPIANYCSVKDCFRKPQWRVYYDSKLTKKGHGDMCSNHVEPFAWADWATLTRVVPLELLR